MVAKGGTVKFNLPKAPANAATMVGQPTPASQPQRLVTPPPVVRAATPAPSAPAPAQAAAPQPPVFVDAAKQTRPSVLGRQHAGSSKLPLAIAAGLVLMLAGGAYAFRAPLGQFVGGFTAGFSGEKAYEQGVAVGQASNPVGTTQAATPSTLTPSPTVAPVAPTMPNATPAGTGSNGDAAASIAADNTPRSDANAVAVATPPVTAPATDSTATPSETAPVGPVALAQNDAPATDRPAIKRLLSGGRGERREVASSTPPREVAPPATPRIAVIALGDSAIVGPARQRIEERLMDAGFDVVDIALIPGVDGRRDLPGLFAALRANATVAVVINAEPVGSAPIQFYGQVDTLYTANLTVRSYFIPERRPLGAGFRESVSFTAMGAAQKAEEAVEPRLDRLLGELSPYRRGRGRG
jgi:hypothetical protein